LEHLIIPGLNVSITTSNDYHSANVENTAEYNLDEYLDMTELGKYQETLENNKKNFEMLLDTAIKPLQKQKHFMTVWKTITYPIWILMRWKDAMKLL